MNMIEATFSHADIVGKIHSLAWRQAYEEIFPAEYIAADTPENRKKEFLDALQTDNHKYYLVYEKDECVGVVKVVVENKISEIASIYFLKEFYPWFFRLVFRRFDDAEGVSRSFV